MENNPTIENKAQLIEYLEKGSKPASDWRIGTEHEKFCFDLESYAPLGYEGSNGIKAVLEGFQKFGWQGIVEHGHLIALAKDGASVTLEPAGQLELSGAPLETIHQTCDEVTSHLYQAKEIGNALGVGFLGLGFHPTLTRKNAPLMPKVRYEIMRDYMPKVGNLGLDMMLRTTTVRKSVV